MSGGAAPPAFVPAPAPSVVTRIGAPAAPTFVTTPIPGPMGPPGPPGAPGYAKRFGTIDYTDNDAGTSLPLPIGTWVLLTRNLTPSSANYNLTC